ncbi:MAG: hypothetical protein FWJ85_03165 [Solitalea sp.]
MRKTRINKMSFALALTWILHGGVIAQHKPGSYFEGVVEYTMQVEGTDLSPELASKIPRGFTLYLKDASSRLEMATDLTDLTVLADNADRSAITLMTIMGKNLAIRTDSTQLNKALGEIGKFDIHYLPDEKTILGYPCKKAILLRKNTADTTVLWYTTALRPIFPSSNQFLPNGNWFPMEVQATHQGARTTLRVRTIDKGPVEDSLFVVPEGYRIIEQGKIREQLLGL